VIVIFEVLTAVFLKILGCDSVSTGKITDVSEVPRPFETWGTTDQSIWGNIQRIPDKSSGCPKQEWQTSKGEAVRKEYQIGCRSVEG
jgi:hypothetical protein